MTLLADTRLGPYEVVDLIGAGGMGEVYRARDPRLSRAVAVKLITAEGASSPERLRRFETEARAAAQLAHPNVVTVFDVGTHEGHPYLVLELLEGQTLRETLKGGIPPLRQSLTWMLEAARGLGAAHERGIVHRDFKPENVFLTKDGRVKVLDFGLAKLQEPLVSGHSDTSSPTATKDTSPGVLLGTIGYMSPEQVKGEPAGARTDVFALGAVLYELLSGRRAFGGQTAAEVLASILRDEPPSLMTQGMETPASVETVVRRCLGKHPSERFSSGNEAAVALETVLSSFEPSRATGARPFEPRGPYPGLSSFTEADAERFFGREAEVESLWEKLRQRRLLALIGPSGAGKTSFARAGLVASRPTGWGAVVATPGAAPMRALAQALIGALPSDPDTLRDLLAFDDAEVAFRVLQKWRRGHLECLLVLDQLEELFTLNPPEVQASFAELLGRLAGEGDVHVLLSLRDDFLIRCHDHASLAPVFQNLTPLTSLGGEDLRRALVEPAKKEGYAFEDEALVEEMLESVVGARGALPLLAFAVARLWEKRDRENKLLTRRAYEEIGGVAGALAQHAEQTLERIGFEREPIVRELFRNLVTAQWTRAVAEREQLVSVIPDREAADQVLDELIAARLLTSYEVRDSAHPASGSATSHSESVSGEDRAKNLADAQSGASSALTTHRIEIVHESLIRAWPRLVRWQAQDEEGAVLRDQLKQAAHVWEEKGRSPDVLWSGTALREYELWRGRYAGKLTVVEESFAGAMLERDRRRRRWRRAAVTGVIAALATVAVVVSLSRQEAVRQAQRADQEAQRAEAGKLLALAQIRLDEDPTEALALATASLELTDSQDARRFVVEALNEAPPAREVAGRQEQLGGGVFSPDGKWLAGVGHMEEALVWPSTGEGPSVLPGHQSIAAGGNTAWWLSPDRLVTGVRPGLGTQYVQIWSLPSGERLRMIEFGGATFWQVGNDGRLLTATVESGTQTRLHALLQEGPQRLIVRSWDVDTGEARVLGRVTAEVAGVDKMSLEPNGRGWLFARGRELYFQALLDGVAGPVQLLARHSQRIEDLDYLPWTRTDRLVSRDIGGDNRIWFFPREGPRLERLSARPEGAPEMVFADPSGRWLVGPFQQERQARVWDTASLPGARPLELRRSGLWGLGAVTFQPDGRWLVAATHDMSRLTLWPLPPRPPAVVDGYRANSRPVAFSPDSQWLATIWTGGIRLWPLPGGEGKEVKTLPRGGVGLGYDWRGRRLLQIRPFKGLVIIPLDGSPPTLLKSATLEANVWAERLAVSPSGRRAALGHAFSQSHQSEPQLSVWDLEAGEERTLALPPSNATVLQGGYRGGVGDVHFADESTLFTSGDGGLRRWDLDTGTWEQIWTPEPQEWLWASMSAGGEVALMRSTFLDHACRPVELLTLATGEHRDLPGFGSCVTAQAIDPNGRVAATGAQDGTVRVGRLSGGAPHILGQHEGPVLNIAISPDLRWVASSGDDATLRLWPMPDLDKPPLHTLPHEELIAKLKSLTNIRAVRDPESSTGWSFGLDPFPGWKEVPEW